MPHYLIRHAHAVSDEEDPLRPLSERGRRQVADLCAELRGNSSFQPAEIWHSPLARSRETAMLLASGLGLPAKVIEKEGLEPEDSPRVLAQTLEKQLKDVAVVGHEPFLGVLAARMAGMNRHESPYSFPKAGVMALRRHGKHWRVEWIAGAP